MISKMSVIGLEGGELWDNKWSNYGILTIVTNRSRVFL